MNRLYPLLLILAIGALFVSGCGGKKMTDEDFVTVGTTIYENVRAGWDVQPNEAWDIYYDRRIGEACSTNGFEIKAWDKQMRAVAKHPEKWQDKFEPGVLDQLLKWQADRLVARPKR